MDSDFLYGKIQTVLPELDIRRNEAMRAHCSFRIGGPAALFASIKEDHEIIELTRVLRHEGVRPIIIGRGTNILVPDEGIDAFVINISGHFDKMEIDDNTITAQSGVRLARLAVFAQQNGLGGLEFAHGIPGSLGGAITMNAGAYGGEMKDIIIEVTYLSPDGDIHVSKGEENDFSYRHSRFSDTENIILGAKLRLTPRDVGEILETMDTLAEKRNGSQPLNYPSAGSTFKRPDSGYAAVLIDKAGLKGYRVGGAMVSEKHAGFVINVGGATFGDVIAVMSHISDTVFAKSGIRLVPEVKILQ